MCNCECSDEDVDNNVTVVINDNDFNTIAFDNKDQYVNDGVKLKKSNIYDEIVETVSEHIHFNYYHNFKCNLCKLTFLFITIMNCHI